MPYINCHNCTKETSNPAYCSRSCAATANNKQFKKRQPTHICKRCGNKMPAGRHYCSDSCRQEQYIGAASKTIRTGGGKLSRNTVYITLLDVRKKYSKYIPAAAYNIVRQGARRALIKAGRTKCESTGCTFMHYFEAAHRRPISSYPFDTEIGHINAQDNLIPLCPNHHWEFDKGFLKV